MSVSSIAFVQIKRNQPKQLFCTATPYALSGQLQLRCVLQPRLGTGLPTALIFCPMYQTKLCYYSNFFAELCGRTCLTFPFTCWKVFVPCQQLKLNKACNAVPGLTAPRDRSSSRCPRAARSRSIAFSRRQKGQQQRRELCLPPWWLQCVAGGRTCRLWRGCGGTWHSLAPGADAHGCVSPGAEQQSEAALLIPSCQPARRLPPVLSRCTGLASATWRCAGWGRKTCVAGQLFLCFLLPA